ncbi:hypothetical protein QBC44DRAFT_322623 [Cladorrhinum sp. PSN332]|nr:hypothetical protein QBC44DRAFT_322623 [Cladorrhinum sp. PSN332]
MPSRDVYIVVQTGRFNLFLSSTAVVPSFTLFTLFTLLPPHLNKFESGTHFLSVTLPVSLLIFPHLRFFFLSTTDPG